MADVTISDRGSVVLFTLGTPTARAWVDAHVALDGWQWMGGTSFAVDHRFAAPLAEGMRDAGLDVA